MTPDEVEFFQTQLRSLSALSKLDMIDELQYLIKSAKSARMHLLSTYEPDSRAYEDQEIEINLINKILSWLDSEQVFVENQYKKLEGK